MGQRGPRPKPLALKLLAGNPGKRAGSLNGNGRIRKGAPDRPAELTGAAAAEWDALVVELDAAGLLAVTDRGILSAYCLAVADMLAAADAINAHGRWQTVPIQSSKGETFGAKMVENPAVKQLDKASARVKTLGAELGLTPAARLRIEGDAAGIEEPEGNAVLEIRERIRQARS